MGKIWLEKSHSNYGLALEMEQSRYEKDSLCLRSTIGGTDNESAHETQLKIRFKDETAHTRYHVYEHEKGCHNQIIAK